MTINSHTTIVRRLQRELHKAKANVNKYISRPGIHYSWFNAAALDLEIQYRREFAVRWREEALALANLGQLSERTEEFVTRHSHKTLKYRVYAVDGVDRLAIATNAGSNSTIRLVQLGPDQQYKNYSEFVSHMRR